MGTMRNQYLLAGIMIGLLLIIAVSAQTDTSGAGTGTTQLQDQSKEEGWWYLQGEPVITTDEEIDLPPCYTDKIITVTNGEGHDSVKWSAECFKDRSGTHTSDVKWTQPPDYMEPGSNISFSMTFTSPFYDIPIGGGIYANGVMFLEGRSTNPQGKITATYKVPNGSQDEELEINTSFILISGLHGYIGYKYKYLGPDTITAPATPETIPKTSEYYPTEPDTRLSYTFDPRSLESRTGFNLTNVEGEVYVHRNGEQIPAGNGFQLRVGDKIVSFNEFSSATLNGEGFRATIKPNSEIYIKNGNLKRIKLELLKPPVKHGTVPSGNAEAGVLMIIVAAIVDKSESNREEGKELEMEMQYGTAAVKHTVFVCEQTSDASILKVLNGTVKFTSKVTGEEILANDGQMVTATATGLSPLQSFDVEAEKANFGKHIFLRLRTPNQKKAK